MERNRRSKFAGAIRHIRIHAPLYGFLLLLVLSGGLLILLSAWQGWWAFVPPAMVALIVGGYFGALSLWAAYVQYDVRAHLDHNMLFEIGGVNPTDRFAHINLGSQVTAVGLARRLTGGHITVIDVYNPRQTPRPEIVRMRSMACRPPADPRLTFIEGSLNLLPLPDKSVQAVTMCRILSEFWEPGDRLLLLQEVYRILPAGGQLLVAERVRSEANALVMGPAVLRLDPLWYWAALFKESGFRLTATRTTYGLVHYFRAEKPRRDAMQQLAFDFGL